VQTPRDLWKRLGGGDTPPPSLARFSGPLLILGGARCVWDDLKRVTPWSGDVMAVNDVGMHYAGRLRHWVTLHPEYMPGWMKWRLGHCMGEGARPETHSSKAHEGIDRVWPPAIVGGSSGQAAGFIGLMLGYAPIVYAGCPMDGSGHYFDPPWRTSEELTGRHIEISWEHAREIFAGRVTSLSGNTRRWLGAPDFLKEAA